MTAQFPDPIPGVIPFATVTLFAGAPAAGKTTMLAEWCARWRDGLPICGHPTTRPTQFMYLACDRAWAAYAPMFAAAGFPDIPHYSLIEDGVIKLADLRKPYEAHRILNEIFDRLDLRPGAHVFIDPIAPLFITGDSNRNRDVAVSMIGFSRRCVERAINLTCTAHFGKQKADPKQRYLRPQDRIAGATAFSGFSHTQVYLCDPEPPKQPWHLLGWNPREKAAEEFRFVRDAQGLFVPHREEMDAPEGAEQVLACFPAKAEDATLELLVLDARVRFNLPRRTVQRALQALIQQRRVIRMGRGKYRRVPPS